MRSFSLFILLLVYDILSVSAQNNDLLQAGVAFYNRGEFDSALNVFEKNLVAAQKAGDRATEIELNNYIGHVYSQNGKAADALKCYQLSATLSEETGNNKSFARSLINIGALYEEQKDYTKALDNYSRAEKLGMQIHDSSIIADCSNNKGVVYEQYLLKYPEAIAEYSNALAVYTKMNDRKRMAMSYNNLGIVYKYLGNYQKAIEYYKRSLHISQISGDQFMIAANMTNIGNVYAKLKDFKNAVDYNTSGLEIALKIKAMNVMVEAASSLADDYEGLGDFKKAYEWHKLYSEYSDSLISAERTRQIGELESKYQAERKEKEITVLKEKQHINELNIARQKIMLQKRNYQFAGIGGSVIMMGIVIFLLYSRQHLKQKQQRERAILEAEYRERKRISREMHDDIGAGLTQITLMSEHARLNDQYTYKNDLAAIAATSRQLISSMSEIVWSLNPENRSLEMLFTYLREQLNKLLEYSNIDFYISFPESDTQANLTNEQRRNIVLTIKEIVHNAVKYSKAKELTVHASLQKDILRFEIKDNGCGFDTAASYSGNGMRNIKQRIHEIGGELIMSSGENEGSSFLISIPVEI